LTAGPANDDPQLEQNVASSLLAAPHFGHCLTILVFSSELNYNFSILVLSCALKPFQKEVGLRDLIATQHLWIIIFNMLYIEGSRRDISDQEDSILSNHYNHEFGAIYASPGSSAWLDV